MSLQMLKRRVDPPFDRDEGSGSSLSPLVSLPMPSLFPVSPGEEKHEADQGSGGEIGGRKLQHAMLIGEGPIFLSGS